MKEYHKIQTVFKRDPETKFKTLLEGEYSLPEFEYLKDNEWIFTEKIDGTNIRIMINGENITFGGKTDNAQIPSFLVTKLNNTFLTIEKRTQIKEIFKDGNVCLYGEGFGAKIQKEGGNYIKDGQDFILFDVKIGDTWLERHNVEDIAFKLNLKIVPIIRIGKIKDMIDMCKDCFNSTFGDFRAEGLVGRPKTELKTRLGHRVITKLKCKDFKELK